MEIEVRPATAADRAALAAKWPAFGDPGLVLLVASEGGRLTGVAGFGPPRDREFRTEVCAELHVVQAEDADTRSALLDGVISELPDRIRTLVSWIPAEDAVFYESQGFRPDGARRPLDQGGRAPFRVRYRRTLSRRG